MAQNKTPNPSLIMNTQDVAQDAPLSAAAASLGLMNAAKLAEDIAYDFAARLDHDSLSELIVTAADLTRLSDVLRRLAARQA